MQSPINIFPDILIPASAATQLEVQLSLTEAEFVVEKNSWELKVEFISQGGYIAIIYNKIKMIFQPVGISFRFPAEHTIEGVRYDGEMVFHFRDKEEDQVIIIIKYEEYMDN